MPRIGYDVGKIENIFARMIASDTFPSASMLSELRKEINHFFTEATCADVIYTRNTDNLFFGMQVMPVLDANTTLDIILNDDSIKIKKYILEIDSKLFQLGLDKREMTAVLLHEIGHIVTSDMPVKQVRMAVDDYFSNKDIVVSLKNSAQYTKLLTFAVNDIIRKANSFIFMSNEEVRADSFVVMCGYGEDLESALTKVSNSVWGLSKSTKDPRSLTVLAWVVNLYTNVKLNRIPAIQTLKKAKAATGSTLSKREIDEVIKCLNRIDTDVMHEGAILLNEAKRRGIAAHIKQSGFKALDTDYYEYKIRAKNVTSDETELIYLMRHVNASLTIIQDTLEEDMSDNERAKWQELYERYLALRIEISNHKVNRKNYGLWYDYDALDDDQKKYSMYS